MKKHQQPEIIGRKAEQDLLAQALQQPEAQLLAVYGRRRVGKTYLIRKFYSRQLLFEFSGVHNGATRSQLENFAHALKQAENMSLPPAVPTSWGQAFQSLQDVLQPKLKKKKGVVFLDEFPWLNAPRSGFLSAFEFFWNNWASKQPNLVIVICGSAASWMIQKVVNNKGGLHNRITRKIRLLPFTLNETADFLSARKIRLDHYQIAQLYMTMGGIPHYLKEVEPGQSAAQAIDRSCFSKDGLLRQEFQNLYHSLFSNAQAHIAIVRALAAKPSGLTRNEIIEACALKTGGTTSLLLDELTESGFIAAYIPFNKSLRDRIYKLSDEYTAFYVKFIERSRAMGPGTWLKMMRSQSWKSWSGLAFESLCLKHVSALKAALGIAGIYTEESAWRFTGRKEVAGCQVDLLIDRSDSCISLCEMKFSDGPFTISKEYAAVLTHKRQTFISESKTRKTVFLAMVTTFGVSSNVYKASLIQNEITLEDLFSASS
ncbi:ATPase [Pedobacter yulinensis]|uniref:ATPase n=1 Tax=Pedobacter yulinensis TaxID=2126353 RepID=A0A2T3HQV5_9SPHI|nr:ATP-binding protein [Pedobacter yulinensis]PST84781.1 ATPase [Pedobacter yulinensis]